MELQLMILIPNLCRLHLKYRTMRIDTLVKMMQMYNKLLSKHILEIVILRSLIHKENLQPTVKILSKSILDNTQGHTVNLKRQLTTTVETILMQICSKKKMDWKEMAKVSKLQYQVGITISSRAIKMTMMMNKISHMEKVMLMRLLLSEKQINFKLRNGYCEYMCVFR